MKGWLSGYLSRVALLVVVGTSTSCRRHAASDADGGTPRIVELVGFPVPNVNVAARVEVRAKGASSVTLRRGPDRSPEPATTRISVPKDGRVVTTLIGLPGGSTSQLQAEATYPDGATVTSTVVSVTTPPLPASLPRIEVALKGDARDPVFLAMNGGEIDDGIDMLVDRGGRVLWYHEPGGGAFALDRLEHGRVVEFARSRGAFLEVGLDGSIANEYRDPASPRGADGHDLQILPDGNLVLLGAEAHRAVAPLAGRGGLSRGLRWDDTVSIFAPDGSVRYRWSTWSHVDDSEVIDDRPEPETPDGYEVAHINAVTLSPDGSMLLSLRNTSTVAQVDRDSGRILWRLGGRRSTFRFVSDPLSGFCRQHDARWVAKDRILLFDNGNCHEPPQSRAVEYQLDQAAETATLIWEFRRDPPTFTRISGSASRLPSGSTLVSFGPRGVVVEVDSSGRRLWEIRTPGFGVYRARSVDPAVLARAAWQR